MLSPVLFNVLFAAALRVVLVRFSEDDGIVQNLVYLNDDGAGRVEGTSACVRRAVWGMLYADDASHCHGTGRGAC